MTGGRQEKRGVAVDTRRYHVLAAAGHVVHPPSTFFQADLAGTFSLASNRLYAVPFDVDTRIRVLTAHISLATGDVSKVGRVGVYVTLPTGLPGRRLAQSDELIISFAGTLSAAMPVVLGVGRYWLVFACDSSIAVADGLDKSQLRTLGSVTPYTAPVTALRFAWSYIAGGDLPADLGGEAVHAHLTGHPPYVGVDIAPLTVDW